eukprot:m.309874 g.309874  ORF g.309874 m.309874 type:complete len:80 (+) comp48369_c0_seq1:701-940(+)
MTKTPAILIRKVDRLFGLTIRVAAITNFISAITPHHRQMDRLCLSTFLCVCLVLPTLDVICLLFRKLYVSLFYSIQSSI